MTTQNATTTATSQVPNFNKVYSQYYSKVLNYVLSKVNGKRHIAEDITQDTFIKVSEHLHNYNAKKAAISTWVYGIAYNKIIDYYRRSGANTVVSVDNYTNEEGEPTFELGDTANADESVNSNDTMTAVNKALNSLREKDKQIAIMYFIDQKQYIEIAEQLDMPLGSVKGLIYRIREKLQSKLANVYK